MKEAAMYNRAQSLCDGHDSLLLVSHPPVNLPPDSSIQKVTDDFLVCLQVLLYFCNSTFSDIDDDSYKCVEQIVKRTMFSM